MISLTAEWLHLPTGNACYWNREQNMKIVSKWVDTSWYTEWITADVILNLTVRFLDYLEQNRSISRLMMPWLATTLNRDMKPDAYKYLFPTEVITWQLWALLTHWGRDKMDAISQTTLSNTFFWMEMLWFRLKFHWSLILRVQLIISQHWFG